MSLSSDNGPLPADYAEQLGLTVGQMPAIVWTTDHQLRITSSEGAGLKGIGLKPNEVVGRLLEETLSHDPSAAAAIVAHHAALAGESAEYESIAAGRMFIVKTEPLRGEGRRIIGCVGVAFDQTEQKHLERMLRESEARLRTITETVPDLILQVDHDGTIAYANRTGLGLTKEQVVGSSIFQWIDEQEGTVARENLRRVFEEGATTHHDTYVDHGGVRTWHTSQMTPLYLDGEVVSAVLVSHDITARKEMEEALRGSEQRLRQANETLQRVLGELEKRVEQRTAELEANQVRLEQEVAEHRRTEAALRENEERFRQLAENITEAFWLADPHKHTTFYVSPGFERIFQRPRHTLYDDPKSFLDGIHPDDRARVEESLPMQARGDYEISYRAIRPDGEVRWIRTRAFPVLDESGEVRRVAGLTEDVTEHRQAEIALQESYERFNRLVNSQFIGIMIVDGEGKVLEANDAFLEMLGYTRDELTDGRLDRKLLIPRHHRDRHLRQMQRLRETGKCPPSEMHLRRGDGETLPVLIGMTQLDAEANNCLCIVLDIYERKKAERKLKREERLLRKLLDLQERDRKLLAYDIHDGFVQDVVGAQMLIEGQLHKILNLTESHEGSQIQKNVLLAVDLLREAIDEGRRMISELRPMIIDEQGIVAAIDYLVNDLNEKVGLRVDFTHRVQFERLSPLLENTVFRVVQEALTNVHRHSQVTRAAVTLFQRGNMIEVSVVDDGVGFDKSDVPSSRFGLRGIRERARLFGGKAILATSPGNGTRIAARFPIDGVAIDRKKRGRKFSG